MTETEKERDAIADAAEANPGIDLYDKVLIFRDLLIDLSPTLISWTSIVTGIIVFIFLDLPPERLNTVSVFLGGGSMAQVASPSKAKQRLKRK